MRKLVYHYNESKISDILRHLIICDRNFIPQLSNSLNLTAYSEKLFRNAERFEAWSSGQLVALVAIYINDTERNVAFISNVSVDPDFLRLRIATELIKNAITCCLKMNYKAIELEVDIKNLKAIELYKSLKFIEKQKSKDKLTLILNLNGK